MPYTTHLGREIRPDTRNIKIWTQHWYTPLAQKSQLYSRQFFAFRHYYLYLRTFPNSFQIWKWVAAIRSRTSP